MNKRSCSMLRVLALAAILGISQPDGLAAEKVTFSAAAYVDHVKRLAADEWGGRGPGQPGIEHAAEYIADVFKQAGLEPAGADGTYFQEFEVNRGKLLDREAAKFVVEGVDAEWKVGEQWIPFPFSAEGEVEGPVAFVGYGIEADRHEYNDYKDFDARGKILLMMRYEPKAEDPEAEFGGSTPSSFSMFVRKARWAANHEAKAVIIVNPPNRDPEKDELYEFSESARGQTYALPMIHVKREVAEALLKKAGAPTLAELAGQIDETRKPVSRDLEGVQARIVSGVSQRKITTRNVLGMLKGDGSTDEVIVIGAHYDHLGTSGEGDKAVIYNGADDNASGTAGVLELARAYGQQPRPRRNILFMTFSAEEMGLLGSKHFVDNPTIDLSRIKFMMNLDMIGRYDPEKFQMHGIETSEAFPELVAKHAGEAAVNYRQASDMFGRSDHASFYRKGIPVLFPFTGLHPQYHQPEDDWELINGEGATHVLDLTYRITREVAEMSEGPSYRSQEEIRAAEEAAKAEQEAKDAAAKAAEGGEKAAEGEKKPEAPKSPPADDAAPRMPRVRLGIMPDYSEGANGLRIESVVEGGAAAKAGLKGGDVIVRIGATKVSDIRSYMESLLDAEPGDEVEIVVERDGKPVTLKVKLEAPPRRPGQD